MFPVAHPSHQGSSGSKNWSKAENTDYLWAASTFRQQETSANIFTSVPKWTELLPPSTNCPTCRTTNSTENWKSLHCYFSTDHHWKYYDWLIMESFFLQTTNILDIKRFCKQQLKLPGTEDKTSDFNTNKCMNPVSAAIFYIQAIDSLQWK